MSRGVLSTSVGTHRGAFTPLDWGLFASIGAIWGSSFLFIAIGLDAFEPGLITWLRVLFGAATLWLVPASRTPIAREDRPRLVALSFLWVGVPFTLFPLAQQWITSGLTGLLNGSLPIFATAIGALMLHRLPGRPQTIGLVVGFAGVAAIAAPSLAEGSNEALGVVLVLTAVGCYGVAINIAAPLTQRYGSLPVMARMVGLGAIWTTPFGFVGLSGSSFSWGPLAAIVALGALGTGLAFVLMGRLVSRVGSSRASFATYLIPVVALVLGAVFLDETVRALSIVGIGLVIAGALLASAEGARRVIDDGDGAAPILEFDPAPTAVIEPAEVVEPMSIAPHAVLCFFQDVIADVVERHGGRIVDHVVSEIGRNPVYEIDHGGRRLVVMHPGVGAPLAAGFLEELIARGCRTFVACGGAGVLVPDVALGHVIVPTSAVRDEGTSYHYLPRVAHRRTVVGRRRRDRRRPPSATGCRT